MIDSISQCYICKRWYDEKVLSMIKIPDQAGYVEKPICRICLSKIEEASLGKGTSKPVLLIEEDKRGDNDWTEAACPICGFFNSVMNRQIRLKERIICTGCHKDIWVF